MKATAKRRRSKKQIEADKKAEEEKKADIENKLAELEEMKVMMAQMQEQLMENQVNSAQINQVQNMLNQGWMKDDGTGQLIPVTDEEESEYIRLSQYDDAQSKQRQ